MPIYHLDVYRLDRLQEVIDLGFEDLLDPAGVVFVEWGDAIGPLLPDEHLRVELRTAQGDARRLSLTGRGVRWAGRWVGLEGLVAPGRAARRLAGGGGRRVACWSWRSRRRRRSPRWRSAPSRASSARPACRGARAIPRSWCRRSATCSSGPRSAPGRSGVSPSAWGR